MDMKEKKTGKGNNFPTNCREVQQMKDINEQLAIKNRRSRRIWKIVAIILAVIVLVNIFIAVFFSVPDLNSNTQNNPLAISDETISIDE